MRLELETFVPEGIRNITKVDVKGLCRQLLDRVDATGHAPHHHTHERVRLRARGKMDLTSSSRGRGFGDGHLYPLKRLRLAFTKGLAILVNNADREIVQVTTPSISRSDVYQLRPRIELSSHRASEANGLDGLLSDSELVLTTEEVAGRHKTGGCEGQYEHDRKSFHPVTVAHIVEGGLEG